jgi:peptidoglycan/LPS O-acetylase OafA/YrhL
MAANTSPLGLIPTEILDAFRGLVAIYVLLAHARNLLVPVDGSALSRVATAIFQFGDPAVLTFFLISGYSIHYRQAYSLQRSGGTGIRWLHYARSRARRLYPPLVAGLCLAFVLDHIGSHFNPAFYVDTVPAAMTRSVMWFHTWPALFGTLTFTQGFLTPLYGSEGPTWSLAYEAFFYLTYPIVLLLDRRLGPLRCLFCFTLLGLIAALASRLGVHVGGLGPGRSFGLASVAGFLALFAYWPAWVGGVFIADVRAGRIKLGSMVTRFSAVLSIVIVLALVIVRDSNLRGGTYSHEILWGLGLFGVLGWVVGVMHGERTIWFASKVYRFLLPLGAMSYSLYIAHNPVLVLFSAIWTAREGSLPHSLWLPIAAISVAMAVCWLVYRVAERPFSSRAVRQPLQEPGRTAAIGVMLTEG